MSTLVTVQNYWKSKDRSMINQIFLTKTFLLMKLKNLFLKFQINMKKINTVILKRKRCLK